MGTEKTEPTSTTPGTTTPGQSVTPPTPPQPQVITPEISDGPKPNAKAKDEGKAQQEPEPLKPFKPKPTSEEDEKKNPMVKFNEQLGEMVAEINGDINNALKGVAQKGLDKVKNSEIGKALGGLSDAIGAKKDELQKAISDQIDSKLDDFKKTPAGQAVTKFMDTMSSVKDTVTSVPDKINQGIVGAIEKATAAVSNIGKKENLDQTVELKDVAMDEKVSIKDTKEDEIEKDEEMDVEKQETQEDIKENTSDVEEEVQDFQLDGPPDSSTTPSLLAEQSVGSIENYDTVAPSTTPSVSNAPTESMEEEVTSTVSNTI